jgi:hypothetical protein
MKTLVKTIPFLALAFACGAPEDDESFDDQGLGLLEQDLSAPLTPTYQFGTRTATARGRCDKVSAGQVCVVPPKKTISYCIDQTCIAGLPGCLPTPFTEAQYQRVKSIINVFDARTGWTFNEADRFNCFGVPADLIVSVQGVGSSGTASNDIRNYGTNIWTTVGGAQGGLVDLTESGGVAGSYQKWTVCRAQVDVVDILAKGASAAQDNAIFDHAAGHAIAACMGLGSTESLTANAFTRRGVNGNLLANSLTLGDACSLDQFSAANPLNWGNGGVNCAND